MSAVKNSLKIVAGYPVATIVDSRKNYDNDPFVLKKVAQAKKMMNNVKLPDHLKSKTK